MVLRRSLTCWTIRSRHALHLDNSSRFARSFVPWQAPDSLASGKYEAPFVPAATGTRQECGKDGARIMLSVASRGRTLFQSEEGEVEMRWLLALALFTAALTFVAPVLFPAPPAIAGCGARGC